MLEFNEYLKIVEEHLEDYFPAETEMNKVILDSMKYSLRAGGKRLRPVLTLSACDYAGGDIYDALPYACAMEYIHTYSLIHDDLPAMDNDELRRGKPSNHMVFGPGMATLAGDGLLNLAFETMLNDMASHAGDPEALKCRVMAAKAIASGSGVSGMVGGQAVDIENEKYVRNEDTLKFIDKGKTSALIEAAVKAGLYVAGADDDTMADLTYYAEKIGVAFQIADDILNVTSTAEEMGKPVGDDEEDDKLT